MNNKGVVLYIGGFELPDKNAAAQRVIGNAYALKQLGYDIIFLNKTIYRNAETTNCFEFKCINSKKTLNYFFSAQEIKKIIQQYSISHIIAYNYPALALRKIIRYCKKNGVKCYADVTEWYEIKGNPIKKLFKKYDVDLRMKTLHKQMDGIIAISEYLYRYYCQEVKTVKIPPLVNINDKKWSALESSNGEMTMFSYVGSPSARKERLDLVVETIEKLSKNFNIALIVVGISQAEFEQMYSMPVISKAIKFMGKMPHKEALEIVKSSDWSIIIRENLLFVQAGFPTKVVESISCKTPVLANTFSNIKDYLNQSNSILFNQEEQLPEVIKCACEKKLQVDNTVFHYSNYMDQFIELFGDIA